MLYTLAIAQPYIYPSIYPSIAFLELSANHRCQSSRQEGLVGSTN
jgi:hypothetical protein